MGAHSVTPEASKLIQQLKAEGQSLRAIAQSVKERLGIALNHVAIKRHLDSIAGRKRERPLEAARLAAAKAPQAPQPQDDEADRPILGEIEALEREATKIQQLLGASMPHRDRTALQAELRATYASIRKARDAEREEAESQSADAAWVLAKLKRFDAMEAVDAPAAADDDEDGLPQATGTAAAR
jgi:hypothetical protein